MSFPTELFDNPVEHQQLVNEAAGDVTRVVGDVPSVLIVAGSGLGKLGERIDTKGEVDYGKLRHFPVSTVPGHKGSLVWGKLGSKNVVLMSGRKHLYEGVDVRQTILPLRSLIRAGVRTVILSNAAGSLNRFIEPGDLMLINDHINLQFHSALAGANLNEMGPRFPDMSAPYDFELLEVARREACEMGIALREGVYLALSGPTYETQAEVGMYKQFADAVGMSTVPEATAAVHAGASVLAISAITNSHVKRGLTVTTHEEVLEVGRQVSDKFCRLVEGIVQHIND